MDSQTGTILSTLLKKRLKTLGYPSLRSSTPIGRAWAELRGAATGRLRRPYPETGNLVRILGSMQFSSSQVRKICGMH